MRVPVDEPGVLLDELLQWAQIPLPAQTPRLTPFQKVVKLFHDIGVLVGIPEQGLKITDFNGECHGRLRCRVMRRRDSTPFCRGNHAMLRGLPGFTAGEV